MGYGWNATTEITGLHYDESEGTLCNHETAGAQFVQCVENYAFSEKEVIRNYHFYDISTFVTTSFLGLLKSLQLQLHQTNNTVLELNGEIRYLIYITDPKLQFVTSNPRAIPRTRLSLDKDEGMVIVFLHGFSGCCSTNLLHQL